MSLNLRETTEESLARVHETKILKKKYTKKLRCDCAREEEKKDIFVFEKANDFLILIHFKNPRST